MKSFEGLSGRAKSRQNLDFSEFTSREMIEHGDTGVVLGTSVGRAKKPGKLVKHEWAHVFKFNQGKAVFFQEYVDTAANVLAMSQVSVPGDAKIQLSRLSRRSIR
jgi:uncharacterized protein